MDTATQSWLMQPPENYQTLRNEKGEPYFIHKLVELSSHINIGRYSYLHGNTRLTGDKPISIGSFCSIASGVRFQTGDEHDYKHVSTFPFKTVIGMHRLNYEEAWGEGILVGNDVWIGEGARILSGSVIGNGAVIGAGSVVRGELEPYGIYYGNPVVLKKMRCSVAIVDYLQLIQWWNWPLEKIIANAPFFSMSLAELDRIGCSIKERIYINEIHSEAQA